MTTRQQMINSQKRPVIKLTQEGYDKVLSDIAKLEKERPEVLVRLQLAREMGDLSENGAYKAARWELGGIDRELKRLKFLERFGKVTTAGQSGVVGFGSTVTLRQAQGENEKEMKFTVVSKYEADPKEKKLSVESPFGAAVLNKRVGDVVLVDAPAGELQFRLTHIE
jgi:transcription elongation factor GreA